MEKERIKITEREGMRNRCKGNIDPGLCGQKAIHQASKEGRQRMNEKPVRENSSARNNEIKES